MYGYIILKMKTYHNIGYRILEVFSIINETENTITVVTRDSVYCVPKSAYFNTREAALEAAQLFTEER